MHTHVHVLYVDACCCQGELRATWSVTSSSSEDDQQYDEDDVRVQSGVRSNAYKATRVFYRNRQLQESTASVSGSDSEPSQGKQEDIKTTRQTRSADHVMTNSKQAADRDYRSNEYLNFNKSAKYKSADHRSADALDKRENSQERRYVSRETARQQRANDKEGRYNDNDKSRAQNGGRQENDPTETDSQSATHGDGNMRYSRTRRSPRKWQLLPIHVAPIHHHRSSEPAPTVPPADDRRPYRRNLPPRMLAKLKQSSTTAAGTEDPVDVVTSSEDVKDSNIEVSQTKVDVTNGAATQQNQGELQSRDASFTS